MSRAEPSRGEERNCGGWRVGPVQWVGTKGLWPQLKGERLKEQQSPSTVPRVPATLVPSHVQPEAFWNGNGNGKAGAGEGP